jgi:hypothetical protein
MRNAGNKCHCEEARQPSAGRRGNPRRLRLPRSLRSLAMTMGTLLLPFTVKAMEVKPVINAQVLGGQYYYNGSENSLGTIASVVASPYLKFNNRWSLVPLYSGSYQGTKQVQDLVGGGTLFHDSQNHVVSVKGIRSFDNGLKVKAVTAYGVELLRETKDEDWTKGLYDNRRVSGGTELEWFWANEQFVRLSYDYFVIRFPNYQSLSSEAASLGQGRELDAPDVLNTHNHMVTLGAQTVVPGNGVVEGSLSQTWSAFPDQHLVDRSGLLTADARHDRNETLSLQGTWPFSVGSGVRVLGSLGFTRAHSYSDQNHYDAGQTFFNPNYYAYLSHSVHSDWTFIFGQAPWTVQWNGTVSRQRYANRLTQDSNGVYDSDVTRVDYVTTGLSVSYPITKGFQVKATTAFGWNDSNNTDNQIYQYHYNTQTYLFGFSYAY